MTITSFSPDILLVDGAHYVYRAYHAYPRLTHFTGEPNGVLFGVLSMLAKLRRQYPGVRVVVLFDGKEGSQRRKAVYPAYKAKRLRAPELLLRQIDPLCALLKALGLPIWEATDGVEADDLLGTLAHHQIALGRKVGIVTEDKDLVQLVGSSCALWHPSRSHWITEHNVADTYGLLPNQMVDFLALVGDTADNIPGVPGIGKQRALQLLKGGHHLVELLNLPDRPLQSSSDFPPEKLINTLRKHAEVALLSYRLAQLDLHVPLPTALLELLNHPEKEIDSKSLYTLLSRWGLKGLWKQLVPHTPLSEIEASNFEVSSPSQAITFSIQVKLLCVCNPQDRLVFERVDDYVREQFTSKAIIFPWYGASNFGLICLGLADYIILLDIQADNSKQYDAWIACLQRIGAHISEQALTVITYQIKNFFRKLGGLAGWEKLSIIDVELMNYVLDSTCPSSPLERLYTYYTHQDLAARYAQLQVASAIAVSDSKVYALKSAYALHELYLILDQKLSLPTYCRERDVLHQIELPILWILTKMEIRGILLDAESLTDLSEQLQAEQSRLAERIVQYADDPLNLESPVQLRVLLFEKLELPVKRKTPKGLPSTDETALHALKEHHPVIEDLLAYRSLSKLRSTYVERLPDFVESDGRIHTTYHQAVTVTGRLSSRQPNLQNLPVTGYGTVIRSAFIAQPGAQLLSADYSQIELRLLAHLSEDERLCHALCQKQDIHSQTAAEIFNQPLETITADQRRAAKTINFGLIYGMSAHGLASNLQIPRIKAQEYIDLYFSRYPGVSNYLTKTKALAVEQGFVETLWGRKLWLPSIRSRNRLEREAAEREAVNAPIQGSCADLIKLAMIHLDQLIDGEEGIKLLLQIHDELLLEVDQRLMSKAKQLVHQAMVQVIELRVPLLVSIGVGPHWAAAHV